MNFELSDEQRMLSDSLGRFLTDYYGFSARTLSMASESGHDPAVWRGFADLGLLALGYAEEDGGFGGGAAETLIVAEAMGRALVNEPWLDAIVLVPSLLCAGSVAQRRALVERIAGGGELCVWARQEPGLLQNSEAGYTRVDEAGQLSGTKILVPFGELAGLFIVDAKDVAGQSGLYLVEADASDLSLRGYATQDGRRAADVVFENTPAQRLEGGQTAQSAIARAEIHGCAAVIAEAVGAMDAAIEITTDYLKQRRQFGQPIGRFQALQHQAADMLVELEQARSMAFLAAMVRDAPGPAQATLSAAKVRMCDAARLIGQSTVQLHGGIGVTMENPIGHYFKRLSILELAFGNRDEHLDRLQAAGGCLGVGWQG